MHAGHCREIFDALGVAGRRSEQRCGAERDGGQDAARQYEAIVTHGVQNGNHGELKNRVSQPG